MDVEPELHIALKSVFEQCASPKLYSRPYFRGILLHNKHFEQKRPGRTFAGRNGLKTADLKLLRYLEFSRPTLPTSSLADSQGINTHLLLILGNLG